MKIMFCNLYLFLFVINSFQFQSCQQSNNNGKIDNFTQIPNEQMNHADSVFVVQTIKELGKLNWMTFQDYSLMYKIENSQVEYFVNRVFYDSERKKMIVWYGNKTYNAPTIEAYSDDARKNRICPNGNDTIYSMSALIGIRDNNHEMWKLYPFDNQSVFCSPNIETAVNIMEQYYFNKMKGHQMWKIIQTGERKGESELKEYGYNIQDKDFWSKCWLWEKDVGGSNGLYPFQIEGYSNVAGQKCIGCGKELIIPKIIYPEEVVNLFK